MSSWFSGGCCGRGRGEAEPRTWQVHINGGAAQHKGYAGNEISTTKYNVLTFLPIALFEQYR